MGTSHHSKKSTFFSIFQKSIQTSPHHMKTLKRHLKHLRKSFLNIFWPSNTIATPNRALKSNSSKTPKKIQIVKKTRFFSFLPKNRFSKKKNGKLSLETCKMMSKLLPDRFSVMSFWKKILKKKIFFHFHAFFLEKNAVFVCILLGNYG